jgi:hypothetical protein
MQKLKVEKISVSYEIPRVCFPQNKNKKARTQDGAHGLHYPVGCSVKKL